MNMNLIITILVSVGAISIISGFLMLIFTYIESYSTALKHLKIAAVVLVVGILFVITGAFLEEFKTNNRDNWNYAVENGYSFYIDGQKVDPNTVIMNKYDIEYDEDNKIVKMASKRR